MLYGIWYMVYMILNILDFEKLIQANISKGRGTLDGKNPFIQPSIIIIYGGL